MGSVTVDITPGNEYKLSRGVREHIRLNAQHHTMTWRQGWLLHPDIRDAIKGIAKPRIADVATGTGIWAIDLAEKLPHADIIGLDISEEQFCPRWTLPSNVSLGLYDLLKDVPSELEGQFDVVHVRLLLSAGPAVDKKVFLDRFRTLLRPGGWLQWDDLEFPTVKACHPPTKLGGGVKVHDTMNHPLTQLCSKYLALNDRCGWFHDFDTVVTVDDGYERIACRNIPIRPHLLQMESDSCVAVFTDLLNMLIQNKNIQDPAMLNELQKGLAVFVSDAEKGVLFSYAWTVGIARKSSNT